MTTAEKKTTAAKPPQAARPTPPTASGAGAAAQGSMNPQQHLARLMDPDVLSPEGLHEFCESMRALSTTIAFTASVAATQLDQAARKSARDRTEDGRLTLAQKGKLRIVLRGVSKLIGSRLVDALLDSARASVLAYGKLEEFLDEVESATVSRPHRSSRGGFSLNRSS
jgi:hypothetical protein